MRSGEKGGTGNTDLSLQYSGPGTEKGQTFRHRAQKEPKFRSSNAGLKGKGIVSPPVGLPGKTVTEAEYSPQDILTLDRDISLYAVWEKEKDGEEQMRYSLTYHGNNETDDAFVDSGTPCPSGSTVILAQNSVHL